MTKPGRTEVPADISGAYAGLAEWRSQVGWPIRNQSFRPFLEDQYLRSLDFAERQPGLLKDIFLLALPPILAEARFLSLLAGAIENEAVTGIQLATASPEIAFLRAGTIRPERTPVMLGAIPRQVGLLPLRRLARISSWSRPDRLMRALMAPETVAISHNPLLAAEARRTGRAVGFSYATEILNAARQQARTDNLHPRTEDLTVIADTLCSILCSDLPLMDDRRKRLQDLINIRVRGALSDAADDLALLARQSDLPASVWSANGGHHPARAIMLSVRARGGKVTAFDHGGTNGTMQNAPAIALVNLSVCTDYVAASPAMRNLLEKTSAPAIAAPFGAVALRGGGGDPVLEPCRVDDINPVNGQE